jgi:hypothetical protein
MFLWIASYAEIPEILPDKKNPFSWVKVKGSIDGVEISKYHLMPTGKGTLMLAVKSEIRKKIKKNRQEIMFTSFYIPTMNLWKFPKNCCCACKTIKKHCIFKIR